jgi:hypothetical protein
VHNRVEKNPPTSASQIAMFSDFSSNDSVREISTAEADDHRANAETSISLRVPIVMLIQSVRRARAHQIGVPHSTFGESLRAKTVLAPSSCSATPDAPDTLPVRMLADGRPRSGDRQDSGTKRVGWC